MKRIVINLVGIAACVVLIVIVASIDPVFERPEEEEATPTPTTAGYISRETIAEASETTVEATEPERTTDNYNPFTYQDVEAIAKTIWGEARGCDERGKWLVAVTILNRYAKHYGGANSPYEVVSAPGQFSGYSDSYPVTEDNLAIAIDAIQDWNRHEAGEPQEWYEYIYFTGNGKENIFR